jgi:hypothetical protein
MAEKTKKPLSHTPGRFTMKGFPHTWKVLKACKVN